MPLLETYEDGAGWTHRVFTPDTDPDDLGGSGSFKQLWDSARGSRWLPPAQDIHVPDTSEWAGWADTAEVPADQTLKAVVRLWSALLVRKFGIDPTDHRFVACIDNLADADQITRWEGLRLTPNVITSTGTMGWLPDDHHYRDVPFTFVTLPCGDNGTDVDRYVSALRVF